MMPRYAVALLALSVRDTHLCEELSTERSTWIALGQADNRYTFVQNAQSG